MLLRHLRRRPPYLLLSHGDGEEFEERARLASKAVARIDLYVELLLCLEAVDRVIVEYFDVSVGWVQLGPIQEA